MNCTVRGTIATPTVVTADGMVHFVRWVEKSTPVVPLPDDVERFMTNCSFGKGWVEATRTTGDELIADLCCECVRKASE